MFNFLPKAEFVEYYSVFELLIKFVVLIETFLVPLFAKN